MPALELLGFTIAANMHAPELASMLTWTQVLFIHRERGDRASVMYLRPTSVGWAGRSHPTLAFATEWSDGRSVKTNLKQPSETAVMELYECHCCDVEAQRGPATEMRGIVPEPGGEAQWLSERAGLIAGSIAKDSSYVLDRDGVRYRPGWRRAFAGAWKLMWMKRRKRGFHASE